MYKRNKQETYAWLLVATRLSLPNEMVMRVCDYLFDKVLCAWCGLDNNDHLYFCVAPRLLSKNV